MKKTVKIITHEVVTVCDFCTQLDGSYTKIPDGTGITFLDYAKEVDENGVVSLGRNKAVRRDICDKCIPKLKRCAVCERYVYTLVNVANQDICEECAKDAKGTIEKEFPNLKDVCTLEHVTDKPAEENTEITT